MPQTGTRLTPSSMVRRATVMDIDVLIEMGRGFLAYSAYGQSVPFDQDQMARGLCAVLDAGVIFVAEKDGEIIGGIAGCMSALWFSPSTKIATEMAWWMKPEHRGSKLAIKLLREFERWGKERGASHVVMSDLVIEGGTPAGQLFEKLGYVLVERSHVKGV